MSTVSGTGSAGRAGGAGGSVTVTNSGNAVDASNTALAYGGAGGASNGGAGGAGGGAYADTDFTLNTTSAVSAYSKAFGGAGGLSYGGAVGAGGYASSHATVTSTTAPSLYALAKSYGGRSGSYGVSFGPGGGATGSASTSGQLSNGTNALTRVFTQGGYGGTGGAATASVASATGYNATVIVQATGGLGYTGGAATLNNVARGYASGGTLYLQQVATGGEPSAGRNFPHGGGDGDGGAATSSLTFDDTLTARHASSLKGDSEAIGGPGWAMGGVPHAGGDADASISLTGVNTVNATATAQSNFGGEASAAAFAISTYGAATASATANSSINIVSNGAENALADAQSDAGGLAQAAASGSGRPGGLSTAPTDTLRAEATTKSTGILISAHAGALAPPGNSTSQTAAAAAGASILPSFQTAEADAAFSLAATNLDSAFVASEISSHSNLAGVGFGNEDTLVFGGGLMSAVTPSGPTGPVQLDDTQTFTLDTEGASGHLLLGLLDDQSFGSGFTDLTFTVAVGGKTVVKQDFSSASAANAYLSNHAFDLGAAPQSADLQVVINFLLTTKSASSDYAEDFLLGFKRASLIPHDDFLNAGKSDFLIENSSGAIQVGQVGSNGQVAYSPLGSLANSPGCSSGRATTSTRATTSS